MIYSCFPRNKYFCPPGVHDLNNERIWGGEETKSVKLHFVKREVVKLLKLVYSLSVNWKPTKNG